MKNDIKKAPVKFREDRLYFQHFMLIFVFAPKSVIITTVRGPHHTKEKGKSGAMGRWGMGTIIDFFFCSNTLDYLEGPFYLLLFVGSVFFFFSCWKRIVIMILVLTLLICLELS